MNFQEKSLEDLLRNIKKRSQKRLRVDHFSSKKEEDFRRYQPQSFEKTVHKINANRRKIQFFPLWESKKSSKKKKIAIIFAAVMLSAGLGWIFPQKNAFSHVITQLKHWVPPSFLSFLTQEKITSSPIFAPGHQKANHFIGINHILSVNTYAPIIATPKLLSPEKLFFANRFGYIFAMNPLSGKLLNRYSLSVPHSTEKKDIVASPLTLQLENNEKAILYVHSKGGFTALDKEANYLYRSERGIFEKETIYASPVPFTLKNKKGFVVATMQGSIATFSQQRGTTLWHKNIKGKSFFATPLVDETSLFLASVDGSLYKIDLKTGRFLWEKESSLGKSVKSSPIMLSTPLGEKRYVVMSSSGKMGIYNDRGKKIAGKSLEESIVSSPAILEKNAAIVGTLSGNVYKISVHSHSQRKNHIKRLWGEKHASFVSPPVILPALNPSEPKDFSVLLIDRNGRLFVVDSHGQAKVTKSLHYHVSSAPLVADINGDAQLDVIVTGEDGHIEIFHLITAKHREYLRNLSVSSGFLHFQ